MRDNLWTEQRVELLSKLWADGVTANVIAERLGGLSRSAVLGKVFRLRLPTGAAPAKSAQTSGRPVRRKSRQRVEPAAKRPSRARTVLELTNNSCRWIAEAAVKWTAGVILSHLR
jgi:GcrA cell cycle regulator